MEYIVIQKDGALVIGEAKGGYNGSKPLDTLGTGYGKKQGTIGWAKEAAKATLRSKKASEGEKKVAKQVLDAIKKGEPPVRVEIFHTPHSSGVAGETAHEIISSTRPRGN